MSVSSTSSVPSSPVSTPPSSLPSPSLSTLSIKDISDEDREAAAKLKAEANKAFTSESSGRMNVPRVRELSAFHGPLQTMISATLHICTRKLSS